MHDICPRTVRNCSNTPLDALDKPARREKERNSKRHPTIIRKATGMYWKCGCPQNEGEIVCPKSCQCTELADEDNRYTALPIHVGTGLYD